MIKKNALSFIAAATMVLGMGAISANAAVTSGMDLEYVASDVATERIVKIYYAGADSATTGISGAEIYLTVEGATVENATVTLPAHIGENKFDTPDEPTIEGSTVSFCLFAGGGVMSADKELATLTLTVPADTGEFTVSVDTVNSYLFDGLDDPVFIECEEETLTIPGATVEPPVDAAVTSGMDLEYVASDVATERIVKIYYAGADSATTGISGAEIYLTVEGATVENATVTLPAHIGENKFDTPDEPTIDGNTVSFCLFAGGGVMSADKELATLTLTVPADTGEFTVSVDTVNSYLFDGLDDPVFIECEEETLTIPGATVEPPVDPEPPVVEPEPETIPATSLGMFTEWDDPDTQAFKASLTAAQSAKTVTWKVTGAGKEKTADANLGTVTGIDMVIGLIVTNAVDGLTATVVVE